MEVVHDQAGSSYRLVVDGETLSHADYHRTVRDGSEVLVFHHTYTRPAVRDTGLAERVVRFALDDARARQAKVAATCWFVADFLRDHQEYADLVA